MKKKKMGDQVTVHYTGKLKEDGTIFDSSKQDDREPLSFKIGSGQLISGFENAVVGMEPGDVKEELIPYEGAYGESQEELVLTLEREKIPEHIEPEVGLRLEVNKPEGKVPVVVTEVTDEAVTIDANHPRAGKDLVFEIELVEIAGKKKEAKK